MSQRNKFASVLIILSLVALYPGLTSNVLTIQIAPNLPLVGKLELFKETRSIMGTIQNLYKSNNSLVANLILLFSVIIPFLKATLLIYILLGKNFQLNSKIFSLVRSLGKWSMADVFIVAVFIAFLSTGSMKGINAFIESGFYYFVAYCLISLLVIQVMEVEKK